MEERGRKRRRRKHERMEGNAFMDSVRDAFVRHLALEKWREVTELQATPGVDVARAIEEAGQFPGRGPYHRLWASRWRQEVRPDTAAADAGSLFASIERAVAGALGEEEAERQARGDSPLEEDPEYKAFVDHALEQLLREGGADLGAV